MKKDKYLAGCWKKIRNISCLYIFLATVSVALKTLFALFVAEIITAATGLSFSSESLLLFCVLLIAFLAMRFFVSHTLNKVSFLISERARMYLRKNLLQHILASPLYKNLKVEKYDNWFITDVNMLVEDFYKSILDIVESGISLCVAIVVLLLKANLLIVINILLFAALQILLPRLYRKRLIKTREEFSAVNEQHFASLKEYSDTRRLFYSRNFTQREYSRYADLSESFLNVSVRKDMAGADLRILSFVLSTFMYLSTMIIGAWFAAKGEMEIGMVVAASQLMNQVTNPLSDIVADIGLVKASSGVREKVRELLADDTESDRSALLSYSDTDKVLELRNISYISNDITILKNINLTVNRGDKVLIFGESGSGKTTLIKLIMKEIFPSEGTVTVFGCNSTALSDDQLHEKMSYVPAEAVIYNADVKENVTPFVKVQDWESVVSSLGLQEKWSDFAPACSMGEKQRTNIARSIVENREIMIADEPTAHLDDANRGKALELLIKRSETLIVITHDLNMTELSRFNRLLEIKDGMLFERSI